MCHPSPIIIFSDTHTISRVVSPAWGNGWGGVLPYRLYGMVRPVSLKMVYIRSFVVAGARAKQCRHCLFVLLEMLIISFICGYDTNQGKYL